jgi:UDP-2,3-diacylglucosamine hydrolase
LLTFQLEDKYLYFASDFHLGAPDEASSRIREQKIIRWLDVVAKDAAAIFLVGDIFDFWFEYKHCVPKGFNRFIGKLAELKDRDIPVFFFTGNHDMWMFDYFPDELNIPIFKDPIEIAVNQKILLVGHGDGLGPGDHFYKFLKTVFKNSIAQWLFQWLHPNVGIGIARLWSKQSRLHSGNESDSFKGDKEWLYQYSKDTEAKKHHDLYIFGHRHLPINVNINESSKYINLGEWISQYNYLRTNGTETELLCFESEN